MCADILILLNVLLEFYVYLSNQEVSIKLYFVHILARNYLLLYYVLSFKFPLLFQCYLYEQYCKSALITL